MGRISGSYKTVQAIPGITYKSDGNGNIWGGIDRSCAFASNILKNYEPLEWINKHRCVFKNIERRILDKNVGEVESA